MKIMILHNNYTVIPLNQICIEPFFSCYTFIRTQTLFTHYKLKLIIVTFLLNKL